MVHDGALFVARRRETDELLHRLKAFDPLVRVRCVDVHRRNFGKLDRLPL